VPGVVDELERTDRTTRAVAFRSLSKGQALAVFEDLDPELQSELLDGLRGDAVTELLEDLDPDDRAGLLDELPAGVAQRLLQGLSKAERDMTTTLLGYPPRSAARHPCWRRRRSTGSSWPPGSLSDGGEGPGRDRPGAPDQTTALDRLREPSATVFKIAWAVSGP
jgi:hypothetical protein